MSQEAVAVAAGIAFAVNLIAIVVAIYKLGQAVGKFELIGKQQAGEISSLKEAVKEVSVLVTDMALHNQRLDNLSARLNRTEKLIEDIRRGEGMILPLKPYHEVP